MLEHSLTILLLLLLLLILNAMLGLFYEKTKRSRVPCRVRTGSEFGLGTSTRLTLHEVRLRIMNLVFGCRLTNIAGDES